MVAAGRGTGSTAGQGMQNWNEVYSSRLPPNGDEKYLKAWVRPDDVL
jgi:hypothetical protein